MTLNNFDEFIDKTDYLQTRLLQVNSCGSERVVKYDYTILRSNGRRDFHFLYLQNLLAQIENEKVPERTLLSYEVVLKESTK